MAKLNKRTGKVTFKGSPLTLLGPELKVGDLAPDFKALREDLGEAGLKDFTGGTLIISAVPSLDTGICDLQTRRFNQEAAARPNVRILTISMDLPFAQKRWCGAAGVDKLTMLSDHRAGAFGLAYGILIEELRLLARAVFVIGPDGKFKHVQLVPEIATEPDYAAALAAL